MSDFLPQSVSFAFGGINGLSVGFYYGKDYKSVDYNHKHYGNGVKEMRSVSVVDEDMSAVIVNAYQIKLIVPKVNLRKVDKHGNLFYQKIEKDGCVLIITEWDKATQHKIISIYDKDYYYLLVLQKENEVNTKVALK